MPASEADVTLQFAELVQKRLAGYPVQCSLSPDDNRTICVRVFAVPDESVGTVRREIREIALAGMTFTQYSVLPMVKTVAVTREYYPELMPKAVAAVDRDFGSDGPVILVAAQPPGADEKWRTPSTHQHRDVGLSGSDLALAA